MNFDKTLGKLNKKDNMQKIKIRNENEDITTNVKEMKRIIK